MASAAVILAVGSLALAATSAGLGIAQGIQQKKQADKNAEALRRRGEVNAAQERRDARFLLGAQRAAFAKAGVTVSGGTPLGISLATAAREELNALRIQFGFEAEAVKQEFLGEQARATANINAANTLLGASISAGKSFASTEVAAAPASTRGSTSSFPFPTGTILTPGGTVT